MKRRIVLGGTGVLGRVIAWRLIRAGWAVEVTGRDSRKMPRDLAEAGARFIPSERRDSGHPVTLIRASKVRGEGAGRPREWMFVKRVLDKRPAVFLANAGLGGDHTTAAANTAALVERVSRVPGARILNSADPDAPNARQIADRTGDCPASRSPVG